MNFGFKSSIYKRKEERKMSDMSFADRLKQAMKDKNLKQVELLRAAQENGLKGVYFVGLEFSLRENEKSLKNAFTNKIPNNAATRYQNL